MFVFACRPGSLELTLLGKQGTPVKFDVERCDDERVTPASGNRLDGVGACPRTPADGTTRSRSTSGSLVSSVSTRIGSSGPDQASPGPPTLHGR